MRQVFWLGAAAFVCSGANLPASTATTLPQSMGLTEGQWHTVITITAAKMLPAPGRTSVPTEAEAALKKQIGRIIETDDCIAPMPAGRDLVLPGIHISGDCAFEEAAAQSGQMRVKARCGDERSGFGSDFSIDGHYTATTMETTLETNAASSTGGYAATMTMKTQSRRTGPCPGR